MDLGISGRKALLVGASRGLGKACAFALAREGVAVTLVARTRDVLEQTCGEIRSTTGVTVTPVVGDITTPEGRQAALAGCPEPDILLNNADGPVPGDFRDWSRQDWLGALDSMMLGPIEGIRRAVAGRGAGRFGRLIHGVARGGKGPQMGLGGSSGARAGLAGFGGGRARQTVEHTVAVNNRLPGIFESDAQRRHINGMLEEGGKSFDEIWKARAAGNPARRYGRPAELGAYCAFICSEQAGFVTGQNLLVDGGSYPGTF